MEYMSKENLLFYEAYEKFYHMAKGSIAFKSFCEDAFGADFSQDGFSDINQIDYILEQIPKREELHILDIGCGNGKMLRYFQRKIGAHIYGFDYSENAIREANVINTVNSEFKVGVIGEISYGSEKFDAIISMDTMYFAKDMNAFVGQVGNWLKNDGVFIVGYQEGDVVPKTQNGDTTKLARALVNNNMQYEVLDITKEVYDLLKRKRESIKRYKDLFFDEGVEQWYEVILHQTDSIRVSFKEYIENNARYLYKIVK